MSVQYQMVVIQMQTAQTATVHICVNVMMGGQEMAGIAQVSLILFMEIK